MDKAVLRQLFADKANKKCADCRRTDPRWASWNLGVFVCIQCSGTHRSLGVHISKVKSVDLDSWTQEQIDSMKKWGNRRAKYCTFAYISAYFEHKLPAGFDPSINTADFIRQKYQHKKYAMNGPIPEDPSVLDHPDAVQKPAEQKPQQPKQTQPQSSSLLGDDFADFQTAPVASQPSVNPVAQPSHQFNDIMALFNQPTPNIPTPSFGLQPNSFPVAPATTNNLNSLNPLGNSQINSFQMQGTPTMQGLQGLNAFQVAQPKTNQQTQQNNDIWGDFQ